MNDQQYDSLTLAGNNPKALQDLAGRCGVAGIDFHPTTDSTQDVARALAESGAGEWRVVVADQQTAGRGQHGRFWKGVPGSLLMSIILRPSDPASMSLLPIRTALAVARALDPLRESGAYRVEIKWPNDLIIGDRKLGGILVEAQTRGSDLVAIVGIGLNILATPELADDPSALAPISLAEVDAGTTRLDALGAVLRSLRRAPFLSRPTLEPEEIAAFKSRDWLLGRRMREPLAGVARGIDLSGHLAVLTDQGVIQHLLAGRVR